MQCLLPGAIPVQDGSFFPDSSRPIAMTSPNCTGSESMFTDCPESPCVLAANDDVAVVCQGLWQCNCLLLCSIPCFPQL